MRYCEPQLKPAWDQNRIAREVRVIIVNFKTSREIERLLATGSVCGANVLVVDNGSEPEEVCRLARRFEIETLLLPRNLGFAAAVNCAIANTVEPYILLLNPDVVIGSETISTVFALLERSGEDAVTPILRDGLGAIQVGTAGGSCSAFSVAAYFLCLSHIVPTLVGVFMTRRQLARSRRPKWICMACFAAPRETFHRFGYLPEDELVYAEDVSWGLNASAMGARLRVLSTVTVTHVGGVSGAPAGLWKAALIRLIARRNGPVSSALAAGSINLGLALRQLVRTSLRWITALVCWP